MRERKNVYKLPEGDKTLEWYGKAVIEMRKRPANDPRSWYYQAAIHGFNRQSPYWREIGPLPGAAEQQQFWQQCQHQSWFFLPWHRMYLAYFEQIVAQTVVDLGGPTDWSLPFWDYSDSANPKARIIPPKFTTPANNTNGLWMAGRISDSIPERYVSLKALDTLPFVGGDGRTAPVGFGGPETSFSHYGRLNGELEELPHNYVHVSIGGAMGSPVSAALDPVFWLHHANIDRLWQVWLNLGNRINPSKSAWLNFTFNFHDKNANKITIKCSDVLDTQKVLSGYTYQDVNPATPKQNIMRSFKARDFSMPLEVVAATNKRLLLDKKSTKVSLKMTPPPQKRRNLDAILRNDSAGKSSPTTFLHFENVTGKGVPPVHDVYISAPEESADTKRYYAGSLSFFGLEGASTASLHRSGSGQHYALDISELMIRLRKSRNWHNEQLDISIEPARKEEEENKISIGRISLYSE